MPNSKETKTLPYRVTEDPLVNHARARKEKSPVARRGSLNSFEALAVLLAAALLTALLATLAGAFLLLLLAGLLARIAALLLLARLLAGIGLVLIVLGHLNSFRCC